MHDHIEWAKFVNSIEYEEWMGHVLFNIPMNINLALKSLNGFVNWSPLIQKLLFELYEYCYLLLNDDTNVSHYTWILIGINCWCLNINFFKLNWSLGWGNEWPYDYYCWKYIIHYHIILLVILDINCLGLKLYEVYKLTYFLLYFWIALFVIFVSHGLNRACKTEMFC